MYPKLVLFFICLNMVIVRNVIKSEEIVFTINGKTPLNVISDKYLSISLEPAFLLTGLNISLLSEELARNFMPLHVRFFGLSVDELEVVESQQELYSALNEKGKVFVTTHMLKSFLAWAKMTNATLVLPLDVNQRIKNLLPFMEIIDRYDMECYWEIRRDCSNKTYSQYKEDLVTLRHVLNTFKSESKWKVLGDGYDFCSDSEDLHDLNGLVDALMKRKSLDSDHLNWEQRSGENEMPLWTSGSSNVGPVSFDDALYSAWQIGEASKSGYKVYFRQLRMHELFAETAVYWMSLLHKNLMGETVLEVKTVPLLKPQISLNAHCTSDRNRNAKRGSMSLFVINNSTSNQTVSLRIGTTSFKNIEVQSYFLTSSPKYARSVYLNNQLLERNSEIKPKIRKMRVSNYLPLEVPARSVSFFVLPGARVPVCISPQEAPEGLDDKDVQTFERNKIEEAATHQPQKLQEPKFLEEQQLQQLQHRKDYQQDLVEIGPTESNLFNEQPATNVIMPISSRIHDPVQENRFQQIREGGYPAENNYPGTSSNDMPSFYDYQRRNQFIQPIDEYRNNNQFRMKRALSHISKKQLNNVRNKRDINLKLLEEKSPFVDGNNLEPKVTEHNPINEDVKLKRQNLMFGGFKTYAAEIARNNPYKQQFDDQMADLDELTQVAGDGKEASGERFRFLTEDDGMNSELREEFADQPSFNQFQQGGMMNGQFDVTNDGDSQSFFNNQNPSGFFAKSNDWSTTTNNNNKVLNVNNGIGKLNRPVMKLFTPKSSFPQRKLDRFKRSLEKLQNYRSHLKDQMKQRIEARQMKDQRSLPLPKILDKQIPNKELPSLIPNLKNDRELLRNRIILRNFNRNLNENRPLFQTNRDKIQGDLVPDLRIKRSSYDIHTKDIFVPHLKVANNILKGARATPKNNSATNPVPNIEAMSVSVVDNKKLFHRFVPVLTSYFQKREERNIDDDAYLDTHMNEIDGTYKNDISKGAFQKYYANAIPKESEHGIEEGIKDTLRAPEDFQASSIPPGTFNSYEGATFETATLNFNRTDSQTKNDNQNFMERMFNVVTGIFGEIYNKLLNYVR